MHKNMTALLAAAFIAGSCTLAMAQAGGTGGAGSEVSTPKANSGPGGPSKRTMSTGHRKVKHSQRHRKHRHG
jgi:hypothetical protein